MLQKEVTKQRKPVLFLNQEFALFHRLHIFAGKTILSLFKTFEPRAGQTKWLAWGCTVEEEVVWATVSEMLEANAWLCSTWEGSQVVPGTTRRAGSFPLPGSLSLAWVSAESLVPWLLAPFLSLLTQVAVLHQTPPSRHLYSGAFKMGGAMQGLCIF